MSDQLKGQEPSKKLKTQDEGEDDFHADINQEEEDYIDDDGEETSQHSSIDINEYLKQRENIKSDDEDEEDDDDEDEEDDDEEEEVEGEDGDEGEEEGEGDDDEEEEDEDDEEEDDDEEEEEEAKQSE